MATNFPTSLDTLSNPTGTSSLNSPDHAGQHSDANDALEAIEAKVGVDSSAVTTSHDYKIGKLEEVVNNASASAPASIDLAEDTDNGTNKITITAPSAIASDKVLTLPDATDTLVGKDTTDTLTNKTLTSPKLNENVALTSTSTELNALDGQTGAWIDWTPSWTNLTVGNGTVVAKYVKIGKIVHFRLSITFGSTTSVSGSVSFSLPATAATYVATYFGPCRMVCAGLSYAGVVTNSGTVGIYTTGATYGGATTISATVPGTWTTADNITCQGTYEAA